MKENRWKSFVFWIVLCEAVGAFSGWLSMEGMEVYNATAAKPAITPPSWVFPVVWIILFALMGISTALVSLMQPSKDKSVGLNLFVTQLIVNFFWPLFFFNLQAFGFAFFWLILLWILVAATILTFYRVNQTAAWLLVPYLVWLTFAAILNMLVWIMN